MIVFGGWGGDLYIGKKIMIMEVIVDFRYFSIY